MRFLKTGTVIILFMLLLCGNFYLSYRYGSYRSSPLPLQKPLNINTTTAPPQPEPSMVGTMGEVPAGTNHISYRLENTVYLRDIINNKLTSEKAIATSNNQIGYYRFSQNLKYVAYIHSSGSTLDNSDEMKGVDDEVVLKDLTTGVTKIILTSSPKKLAATLSFNSNSTKLFIGLDNDDIYSYLLDQDLLTKVYVNSKINTDGFCRGYHVIDESPNAKNLIVAARCYEGTTISIYNIDSKVFTKIGGGYGEGTQIIKFMNDNEIYGYSYGSDPDKYLKINLQGGIIQELPKPTDTPKSLFGLYDNYQTHEIFIADKSKSMVPGGVDTGSRQTIGTDVKDIFFYP